MKLLFTCIGRRVELVQAFRKAAEEIKINLKIIGADISSTAPALFFCDGIKMVCKIKESDYIPQLISICKNERIDCVIPTIDTDLLLLAENKKKFELEGTKVLISDADKVKLCCDKKLTAGYFASLGLRSPLTVDTVEKYASGYPAIIKPGAGSSSIDVFKAEDEDDLKKYSCRVKNYIIQPYIRGREYTVDIFCGYEGNPVYITPRERLAVRSGEVMKTKICQDKKIIEEMQRLIADYRPCGQITVQLIRECVTGEDYYIEINPRFGGGAPLSIKAGADSAGAVLKLLKGEKLTYQENAAKAGAVYSRYDQSICVNAENL